MISMKCQSNSIELQQLHRDVAATASNVHELSSGLAQSMPASSRAFSNVAVQPQSSQKVPVDTLDSLEWGEQLNGPRGVPTSTTIEAEHEGSASRIGFPRHENVASVMPTVKAPYMNRWRAGACLIGYFTQGLNDSVVGALLPYMERQYHISYSVVSVLFMARTLGFLTAGPLTHKLNIRFGRSKTLAACAALNLCAFVMITSGPPYPLVAIAFYLSGKAHAPAVDFVLTSGRLWFRNNFCIRQCFHHKSRRWYGPSWFHARLLRNWR